MSVSGLIEQARALGAELVPLGGTLRVRARRPLPDDLVAELRAHKAEVLAALAPSEATELPSGPTLEAQRVEGNPATVATLATPAPDPPSTVATLPNAPVLETQRFMSLEDWRAVPVPPAPPLTVEDEHLIRGWLQSLGEPLAAIEHDVAVARRREDTRAWLLARAREQSVDVAAAVREAVEQRTAVLEHEAELKPDQVKAVARLARDFYRHLFGPGVATGCCHGRTGRYCAEGKRLRDIYYEAAADAGKWQ